MENLYIAGIHMTTFGKHLEESIKQLSRETVEGALKDAGVEKKDIQAGFYSNSSYGELFGQTMIRGPIVFRDLGFEGIPMLTCENACCSAATAFWLACNFIRAGEGDCALALGAEKMYVDDKDKMFHVFDSAWDIEEVDKTYEMLTSGAKDFVAPEGSESDRPYSVFMKVYAAHAREYITKYGATQRQIASVAAKNHTHSQWNPYSQFRKPFTVEQILEAHPITYPFTTPMCSPFSDGAAACVVVSESGLKRLGIDRRRAIRIDASVMGSGFDRAGDDFSKDEVVVLAKRAYEAAGIGPEDISCCEAHDGACFGEIDEIEQLGFCKRGEGARREEMGEFALGGRLPVNTSGGLESKGHPLGATGISMLFECCQQLRGEAGGRQVPNTRFAMASNGGGTIGFDAAAQNITILSRADG